MDNKGSTSSRNKSRSSKVDKTRKETKRKPPNIERLRADSARAQTDISSINDSLANINNELASLQDRIKKTKEEPPSSGINAEELQSMLARETEIGSEITKLSNQLESATARATRIQLQLERAEKDLSDEPIDTKGPRGADMDIQTPGTRDTKPPRPAQEDRKPSTQDTKPPMPPREDTRPPRSDAKPPMPPREDTRPPRPQPPESKNVRFTTPAVSAAPATRTPGGILVNTAGKSDTQNTQNTQDRPAKPARPAVNAPYTATGGPFRAANISAGGSGGNVPIDQQDRSAAVYETTVKQQKEDADKYEEVIEAYNNTIDLLKARVPTFLQDTVSNYYGYHTYGVNAEYVFPDLSMYNHCVDGSTEYLYFNYGNYSDVIEVQRDGYDRIWRARRILNKSAIIVSSRRGNNVITQVFMDGYLLRSVVQDMRVMYSLESVEFPEIR